MKAENNNPYKNESGYYDGTAGQAICKVTREGKIKARNREKDVSDFMHIVNRLAEIMDFKIEGRIKLIDRVDGRRYE